MQYRVHRIKVEKDEVAEILERFLNRLDGEVVSVFPSVSPTFQGMGATAKVDSLLVVERLI